MKTLTKTIASLCFLIIVFKSNAQTRPSYQLNVYEDSVKIKSIKNFQKLEYIDTLGALHTGKVYFYNDTQFCFVDYFLEPKTDTIGLNSIKKLGAKMNVGNNKGSNSKRNYVSVEKVILICLLTNIYGATYLLIRELYLTIKEGPRHSYKYQNFDSKTIAIKKKYTLLIEPITTSSN
jgi:hypothetical protein